MDITDNVVWLGFLGSLAAGSMTILGAAGVWVVRQLSESLEDILLSAAAGVMLAASVFSLLLPGIEHAGSLGHSDSTSVLIVLTGMMLGATLLAIIYRYTPHEYFHGQLPGASARALKRIWLFVLAIALHNFPEGMAVGVGYARGDIQNGLALTVGIGLQNIPEGLAVAVAVLAAGYSRFFAFLTATASGLIEPLGGLLGATLVSFSLPLLPWVLGAAAGAMLYIISNEIIPQTHSRGHASAATFSLLGGFSIMTYLDIVLG